MTSLTLAIVVVFIMGYLCIALESLTKVNKAPVALLMCVACWTLFMVNPSEFVLPGMPELTGNAAGILAHVGESLREHLGETAETLFFLMGAMTIVEVVDTNGGFNFVRDSIQTHSKRGLLWRIAFMTFFLSAILDNLTTSIVMIMVLRKLVADKQDRMVYAALVIIAANSGGAFSPIGDVTTIMLWIAGSITTVGVITEILVPSLVSMLVPAFIMQYMLKGKLPAMAASAEDSTLAFTRVQRRIIFFLGVGGLMFVPIFRYLTDLPPYMGILLVLGVLWTATEIFHRRMHLGEDSMSARVIALLRKIDMGTILFFLGILMAVGCLAEIGVLTAMGRGLDSVSGGNHYLVTGIIGVLSSIVDNVPLVAGCMGMYPIAPTGDMAVDGIFWQLLAYCAGVGGSMLIIGSAAGVVVMGLEKITFGWYMKRITWVAFVGYLAGILVYWVERTLFFD
ncbi:sodium:proton antiporter [Prevotella sp. HMSC073D09]|jgi:Na+/H+ antiporter, nhaD family|uniref:sodium:proton antiporter NhaD n=1 Tax=Prevotella sp. HMSC073D09 TaxID=1739459 RepID=UPI0008A130D7|nr:sodium:proton antiporter NhaD [Prevotella sp. HMSC073D09]OFQ22280.1 sodium:proton antiporter [Prevotella sp. HMSC073D09]